MAAAPHVAPESEVLERHAQTTPMGRLSFTIVTPGGQIAAGAADELTARGLRGECGVVAGHVPFLAALKSGVVSWRDGEHGRHVLAVDKGYLQVGAGIRVIILVEKALKPEAINVSASREAAAKH